jgi:hypothetical protein
MFFPDDAFRLAALFEYCDRRREPRPPQHRVRATDGFNK